MNAERAARFLTGVAGLALGAALLAQSIGLPDTRPAWIQAGAAFAAWLIAVLRAVARPTPQRSPS